MAQTTGALSSGILSQLTPGTNYVVLWDWLWDATAQCYKGPGLNQCNTGTWRLQTFTLTTTPLAGAITESAFGMSEGNVTKNGWAQVSVGTFRINNDQTIPLPTVPVSYENVQWNDLEPRRPTNPADQNDPGFHWNAMDKRVDEIAAHGVDIVYTFGYMPAWASSHPTWACDPPANPNGHPPGSCYPPQDPQDWKNFVTAITTRYDGAHGHPHIKYWGLWNEPNTCQFWGGQNDCNTLGSKLNLATMAQNAYPIIKAANSSNMVLTPDPQGPSAPGWMNNYFNQANDHLSVGAGPCANIPIGSGGCADIIAFHGYVGATAAVQDDVENVYGSMSKSMKDTMAATGQASKELWDTESGFINRGMPAPYPDFDKQAAWVLRHNFIGYSNGVKRQIWWQWSDPQLGTMAIRNATNPASPVCQAGHAWQQMHDWIIGGTFNGPCTVRGTIWSCGITRKDASPALAMWDAAQTCTGGTCTNEGACSAPLQTIGTQYTSYLDIAGGTHAVPADHRVPVGIKPILLQ